MSCPLWARSGCSISGARVFAVVPGIRAGSALNALFLGAALGLVAYDTYDVTNLSVVEGFNWRIAMIDLLWGTALSGAVAAVVVTGSIKFLAD